MKSNNEQDQSIVKPLLQELTDQEKSNPELANLPLNPPALYEDAGEGYNVDFTFPQQ